MAPEHIEPSLGLALSILAIAFCLKHVTRVTHSSLLILFSFLSSEYNVYIYFPQSYLGCLLLYVGMEQSKQPYRVAELL
jgi:hypothetical protein